MLLHKKDLDILNEIRSLDNVVILTGKSSDETPYLKHIYRLHELIFGETCSFCPTKIQGYISKIKNYNPNTEKMETNKKDTKPDFKLKKGKVIVMAGTSQSYSEHNITDEKAIELLSKNKNRISLFEKFPKEWEKKVEKFEEAKAEAKLEAETQEKEEALKAKINSLIEKGFVRIEDNFNKEDKSISAKELFEMSSEEFNAFLDSVITPQDTKDKNGKTGSPKK